LQDSLKIFQHFIVPESNDVESLALKDSGVQNIVGCALVVLPAVEFDDQLLLDAGEVHDVFVDNDLAAELK
jgi:hypothetical protein